MGCVSSKHGLVIDDLKDCSCKITAPAEITGPLPTPPCGKEPSYTAGAGPEHVKALALPELPAYAPPPLPLNEGARLETLHSMNILDTPADPRFDDITKLLRSIFKVSMAFVVLVDETRCWLKSSDGMDVDYVPRQSSICAWALLPAHPEVLIVQDTLEDARFKNCPLVVSPPNIRFYAGCPLVTSVGHRLGTLCVLDYKTRQFDSEKCNLLMNFAEIVVRQIEKTTICSNRSYLMSKHAQSLLRALDCFSEGLMLCQMSGGIWKVLYVNDAWTKLTGIGEREAAGQQVVDFAEIEHQGVDVTAALERRSQFAVNLRLRGSQQRLQVQFRPAELGSLGDDVPIINIPSSIPWGQGASENYYFGTMRPLAVKEEPALGMQVSAVAGGSKWVFDTVEPFPEVIIGPLLGRGSFGKVYRGVWNSTPVAIKVVQFQSDEANGKPCKRLEEIVTANLSHPTIVRTYDCHYRVCRAPQTSCPSPYAPSHNSFGSESDSVSDFNSCSEGGSDTQLSALSFGQTMDTSESSYGGQKDANLYEVWLLMEFCDLGPLVNAAEKGWFRMPRCFPGAKPDMFAVLETAREIACALEYLHSRNVLHGDLTGSNVLLLSSNKDPRGFSIKVSDFGLSRVQSECVVQTNTVGTATHMPPELLSDGQFSRAVDVYAFGVILWEMYNGERAWAGMHPMQIMFNVGVKKKLLQMPEDAPEDFKVLLLRCMDPEREKRPNFQEILHLVEAQLKALPH